MYRKLVVNWIGLPAAPIPESPAPTIRTSKCSMPCASCAGGPTFSAAALPAIGNASHRLYIHISHGQKAISRRASRQPLEDAKNPLKLPIRLQCSQLALEGL